MNNESSRAPGAPGMSDETILCSECGHAAECHPMLSLYCTGSETCKCPRLAGSIYRENVFAARQAVEALRGERDAYAIVVAACLRDSRIREIGDWDGGAIQDTLTKAGILAETPVTESCGEDCRCVEYDFPATCYRVTPLGFKAYEYADRALSRPEEGP